MDLNYVLIWFVVASCLLLGWRAAGARRPGWAVVALSVLAATGVALVLRPAVSGYIGGGAMAALIVAPLFGYRFLQRAILRQEYGRARRLASLLRWLHPADGWWELPQLLRALESGGVEGFAEAATRLSRGRASRTGIGRLALAILYRMRNEWEELRRWIEEDWRPHELANAPNMIALYIRAFGELGDPNALLAAFARHEKALERDGTGLFRGTARAIALAFCGRGQPLTRLLHGPLALHTDEVKRFWLATADMAAGEPDGARAVLADILPASDTLTAAAIRYRLTHPPAAADDVLTAEARQTLARIERSLDQEERYGARIAAGRRTAYATLALVAANLLAFAVEVAAGGSTDIETLYALGALLPSDVVAGEWWRVAAALFLHYGALHLGVNMLALLVLGPFLERALGWVRYLVAYFAAGLGSMLVIVVLTMGGYLGDGVLVGASGSILGLVGATAAVLLRGWVRERAHIASRRLAVILFIIAFQVAFDLATPQVSFTAHAGGVLIGFLAASLMRHRTAAPATGPGG